MGSHVPNRHGKGSPDGGRFAPDEVPAAVIDTDTLTLDPSDDVSFNAEEVIDPVADLYDKMTYDEDGYDGHGFDKHERHRNGTFRDDGGYNVYGFDEDGHHRNSTRLDDDGYDCEGFDADGFDEDGYNETGVNRGGFDEDGEHRGS